MQLTKIEACPCTKRVKRMRFNIFCAIHFVLVSRAVQFSMSCDITLILRREQVYFGKKRTPPLTFFGAKNAIVTAYFGFSQSSVQ